MKHTIYITEDHQLFSDGLKSMLAEFSDIQIVGISDSISETTEKLLSNPSDLLLLDLNLPDGSGLQIIDFIKGNKLKTKTIIVSMHYEKSYINLARKRGAHGYVPKNVDKSQLIHTIRRVIREGSFFEDNELSQPQLHTIFTFREIEVLNLIKNGYDSHTIAKMLDITYDTLRTHRRNLLQKAQANNIAMLINYVNKI